MSDSVLSPTSSVTPRRRGLSLSSIILLAGLVAVAAVFGIALARQNQTQPTDGPAPDFTMTAFDGQPFRLSDLQGSVVVLNFWASWCGPCRDEAPIMQALHERYQGQEVHFVGVSWTDVESKARQFVDEFGITYTNGLDMETRIGDQYHILGVPETFVIGRDGQITGFYPTPFSERTQGELIIAIDRALIGDSEVG